MQGKRTRREWFCREENDTIDSVLSTTQLP